VVLLCRGDGHYPEHQCFENYFLILGFNKKYNINAFTGNAAVSVFMYFFSVQKFEYIHKSGFMIPIVCHHFDQAFANMLEKFHQNEIQV